MKQKYSNKIALCVYCTIAANDIAHSVALETASYLQKTPLYKHQVKKIVNQIKKEIRSYTLNTKIIMGERVDSYADICDRMTDIVQSDIPKLEYAIKNVFDRNKLENSATIAKIETSRVLLDFACQNLDQREADIRKEANYTIREIRLTKLFNLMDKLSELVYVTKTKDIDLNQDTNCKLAIHIINKKLHNGKLIAESVNASYKDMTA